MAAIADLFNSILGKQDSTLAKLEEIKNELDASKALVAEKDQRISALTAEVDTLKASVTGKDKELAASKAALETEKADHEKTKVSVNTKAAVKAAEISESLGHPPVASAPETKPAEPAKPHSELHGIDRAAAAITAQLKADGYIK